MRILSISVILCLLVGCGNQASQPPNPQPRAPLAPNWTAGERPHPLAVAIPASPADLDVSPLDDLTPAAPAEPQARLAARVELQPIPRHTEPPRQQEPAYGLPLELNIPVPEIPEVVQSPTPVDAIPQP